MKVSEELTYMLKSVNWVHEKPWVISLFGVACKGKKASVKGKAKCLLWKDVDKYGNVLKVIADMY